MTVLFPNAALTIEPATYTRDGFGDTVAVPYAGDGSDLVYLPGRVREDSTGMWQIGVDVSLWPVRVGDVVRGDDGRRWSVQTSQLIRNEYDSYVDYIRVSGAELGAGGAEPGGREFVGRLVE